MAKTDYRKVFQPGKVKWYTDLFFLLVALLYIGPFIYGLLNINYQTDKYGNGPVSLYDIPGIIVVGLFISLFVLVAIVAATRLVNRIGINRGEA